MFLKSESLEIEDQQDEEDMRCPNCKWFFSNETKPYILPCNHNICMNCINILIKSNKSLCPICSSKFDNLDVPELQVNFAFLNLLLKILKTKIIYCKKCKKVFYWSEHYNKCDQSFFIETNKIFDEIKCAFLEGISLIKIFSNNNKILQQYKIDIMSSLNKIINKINTIYEKEIQVHIKKLFNSPIKIDFIKSKYEIIYFLGLCLPFTKYFDTNEISNLLQIYAPSFQTSLNADYQLTNNRFQNPYSSLCYPMTGTNFYENKLLDTTSRIIDHKIRMKKKKDLTLDENAGIIKNDSNLIISKNEKSQFNNTINININNNYKRNILLPGFKNRNIYNKMINDEPLKIFNKKINNLNRSYKNIDDDSKLNNNTNIFVTNKSNSNIHDVNKKFNIFGDDKDKKINKIIIGLKDVKVISTSENIKKVNNSTNHRLIIRQTNKIKTDSNLNDTAKIIPKLKEKNKITQGNECLNDVSNINNNLENKDNFKIFDNNNDCTNSINNDDSEANTLRIENPSLSLMRSTDFIKRIFPLNSIKNTNEGTKIFKQEQINCCKYNIYENNYNQKEHTLKNEQRENALNLRKSINKDMSKSTLTEFKNYLNLNNEINDISNMNKLFNNFNKIKDITNKLKNYNDFINFISENIKTETNNNLSLLNNSILNNFNLLLNEISYNFHQTQRKNILTFFDNSKTIAIYNSNIKKFTIKKFDKILPNFPKFNNSVSIEYDDDDLIFLSGGVETSKYNCSNIFLILSFSNEKITYKDFLPNRKAFHSSLYFDNKICLIGGTTYDKTVTKECEIFLLKEKKFCSLPNLNIGRANASLCIYNENTIYAFRGRNDIELLDTIEYLKLNDLRRFWKIFKPIDYGYVWFPCENSLVMTIDKNKIIICGGNDINGKLYKDTFLLDVSNNNIYKGLDLSVESCFKSQGCLYQGEFFGVDWRNNFNKLSSHSIHVFNSDINCWRLQK